jgi:hypothetical protein
MVQAAAALEPIQQDVSLPPVDVYFFTGKKYWHQTVFCAHSMILHSGAHIRPVIHDDGTLLEKHMEILQRALPTSRIVSTGEIEEHLDIHLPADKFPTLRNYRHIKPLLRKITDFYAGADEWRLFLDSDMLFFHRPDDMMEYLATPDRPTYMVDIKTAYGYNRKHMEELTGCPLDEKINIGIFSLNGAQIDWEKLEYWANVLLEAEGLVYNITQGLSAMLMAGQDCRVFPAEEYVVLPQEEATRDYPREILHHYVAESKREYYTRGWKYILENSPTSQAK